jgi:hypothetical protein
LAQPYEIGPETSPDDREAVRAGAQLTRILAPRGLTWAPPEVRQTNQMTMQTARLAPHRYRHVSRLRNTSCMASSPIWPDP